MRFPGFLLVCVWLATFQMVLTGTAGAHALQPGYLSIEALNHEVFRIFWRKPDVRGRPMPIEVSLPARCEPRVAVPVRFDGQAWSSGWIATCNGGLAGGDIAIPGLDATETDVLVRLDTGDGVVSTHRLTPTQHTFTVPQKPDGGEILVSYGSLGIEHILEGWDHLLFVFCLLLLISNRWRLLGAITAFTIAHSITLVGATLGWLALPSPPVEAVIALSILFLASEILAKRQGELRLSQRAPWMVTFAFGLLHGFGFAGALAEIGLPPRDVPLALLAFNLGVEAGQLIFVGAIIAVFYASQKLAGESLSRHHGLLQMSSAYVIGGLSAFWLVERLVAF